MGESFCVMSQTAWPCRPLCADVADVALHPLLGVVQFQHVFGHAAFYCIYEHVEHGMPYEALCRHHDNLSCRYGDGEGAYQFSLPVGKLRQGKFGYESYALAVLNHAHECLYAPQAICCLACACLLKVAEFYQLVAEAVPLVEQPYKFVVKVGRAYALFLKQPVLARTYAMNCS